MVMTLRDIFETHTGRYSVKLDPYLDIYPRHLSKFIGTDATLIEFGVLQGGSLQIWRKWLGPRPTIIGVDIAPRCTIDDVGERIIVGDQADRDIMKLLPDPDIVIDDCSHLHDAMIATFDVMWPRVKPGGVYVVEDIVPHNMKFVHHAVNMISASSALAILYQQIAFFEKTPVKWREVRAGVRI